MFRILKNITTVYTGRSYFLGAIEISIFESSSSKNYVVEEDIYFGIHTTIGVCTGAWCFMAGGGGGNSIC